MTPRYSSGAHFYMEKIALALDASEDSQRISMAKLVPGFSCREIWPYDDGSGSPLATFKPEGETRIPRKYERGTATWIISSLRRMIPEPPLGTQMKMRILCIGDSQSDIVLARNIDDHMDNGLTKEVVAFIYQRHERLGHADDGPSIVRRYRSWQELELACIADIEREQDFAQFLVIDVDRTLLLPQGLCENQNASIGWSAFCSYVRQFMKPLVEILDAEIRVAFDRAREIFKPYTERSSPHYNDEDARVFAALGLVTGLLSEEELLADADHQFYKWAGIAWARCRAGGWNPVPLDGGWRSSDERWLQGALEDELKNQTIQLKMRDCCVAQGYRVEEERALIKLARQNECYLNGHIVNIISRAVRQKTALPIAYSDRPSASLGLQLMSFYRSRPRRGGDSMIETPLPLLFEQSETPASG